MRDVDLTQPANSVAALARAAPTVAEAMLIVRPLMPTRACRCGGARRCRSPMNAAIVTHSARYSAQIAGSSAQKLQARPTRGP